MQCSKSTDVYYNGVIYHVPNVSKIHLLCGLWLLGRFECGRWYWCFLRDSGEEKRHVIPERRPHRHWKQTWGLIYKTMRRIFTKSLRAPKSQKWRTPKNIPIYKTVRTHTCKQCSLYKSQITRRCAYVNQPHIPPCTRPFLTINSQCKSPHDCWSACKWEWNPIYTWKTGMRPAN